MAQLMLVLDDTVVNVALPSMQRSLHIATPHLNWVASFYALAFGGLLLAGGRAADLFGRLRMFRAGILVFAVASMAGGLAPDATALLAARMRSSTAIPGLLEYFDRSLRAVEHRQARGRYEGRPVGRPYMASCGP
jgi:MFS family permease